MILVDMSQIAVAAAYEVQDNALLKHMILNSLRIYNLKFRSEYGKMVICCDGMNSWRKEVFPLYKENRKAKKKKSGLNWKEIFEVLNEVIAELDAFFPYKVIKMERVEGDDVIAVLAERARTPTIIISSDKDFVQLQTNDLVKQFCPRTKKFITCENPLMTLKEHCMTGDAIDGIPNFISDEDALANPDKRQRPLSKKKIEKWLSMKPEMFCENKIQRKAYERNRILIDFSNIPLDIRDEIMLKYKMEKDIAGDSIMKYLMENRMRQLLKNVNDFY